MATDGAPPSILRMRFSLFEGEGETLPSIQVELSDAIADLEQRESVHSVRITEGDIGVGASGPGFELLVEVARVAFDDTARLATVGGWVLWLVERAKARRRRLALISDGPTLGAVAAARVADHHDLTGLSFTGCRPLTGHPDFPDETDERSIWAAAFEDHERGEVLVVFMSPAGIVLGQAIVPVHSYLDDHGWHERSPEALRNIFLERNDWD